MDVIRVLVVSEKSYEIRQIREQLEHIPFAEYEKDLKLEIFEQTSSKEAFEMVKSSFQKNRLFEIVFAAQNMKFLSGLQLVEKLNSIEPGMTVPSVVFSGDIMGDIKKDLSRKELVDKPILFFQLPVTFEEIKKLLGKLAARLIELEDARRASAIEQLLSFRDTTDFLTTMENIYMRSAREVANIRKYAPWSGAPYISLGRIYIGCNMHDTAIPYLKKALNIDFSLKEAHENLALCYRKSDKSYEELAELKELLAANPKSSSVLLKVGDAYLRESNYKKAAAFYKKAIKHHTPADTPRLKAKSHVGLGKAYLDEGDDTKNPVKYNLAEGEFKTAIDIDPTLVAAYNGLFITLKKLGNDQQAKKVMEEAIKIMPDDAEGWIELFDIYLSEGDHQKAKFSLGKALKYDPENQKILCDAGAIYIRQKMLKEAIELFEKAVEVNPSDLRIYNYLGICHRRLNENDRAITFYRMALNINPNDPNLYFNLAKAYHQNNNLALAIDAYNTALKINPEFNEAIEALELIKKFPDPTIGRKSIR